jgi:hypothetical protein
VANRLVQDDSALVSFAIEAIVGDANGDEIVEGDRAAGIPGFSGHDGALIGCEGSDILGGHGEGDGREEEGEQEARWANGHGFLFGDAAMISFIV